MFDCLSVLNEVLKKRKEGRYDESEAEEEKGEKCQVHDTSRPRRKTAPIVAGFSKSGWEYRDRN